MSSYIDELPAEPDFNESPWPDGYEYAAAAPRDVVGIGLSREYVGFALVGYAGLNRYVRDDRARPLLTPNYGDEVQEDIAGMAIATIRTALRSGISVGLTVIVVSEEAEADPFITALVAEVQTALLWWTDVVRVNAGRALTYADDMAPDVLPEIRLAVGAATAAISGAM